MPLWLCFAAALAQEAEGTPPDDETTLDEPVDLDAQGVVAPVAPTRLRPYASVEVGPTVPLSGPGLGITARAELGLRLPWLGGRILPGFAVGYSSVGAEGTLEDTDYEKGFSYTADIRALTLNPGLRLRVLGARPTVSPELGLGAVLAFESTQVEGDYGGVAMAPAAESGFVLGWLGSAGLGARIGPGEALVSLAVGARPADRGLAGDTSLLSATPLVGYRVLR